MQNKSNLVQLKKSTFRKGMILLYAFFLSLIAFISTPKILTPEPGEKSLRCVAAQWYVGLARAAGQNCNTTCSNWEAADCSGYSSCYKKNISCVNGRDQNGRSCEGCCFDCVVECTPNDEPPSISASISCGQWGTNGWCRDTAALQLSASDPQGYGLTITGNANSTSISCNNGCSIDLPVGSGVANFAATASQSGMSVSGSMNWNYDPETPGMNLNVSGSVGENGWYISPVTVTSTGSDSISGLAGAFLSVNGGQWQTSATLGDGQHNIDITASDYAGNIVNSSTVLNVDTTTPSIGIDVNGEASKHGWFASKTIVSASASDSTSGIASVEFSMDGNPYQSYLAPVTFSGGSHTIQFRVTDQAGNTTETPKQEILVDLKKPTVNITASDFADGIIAYTAHDEESGLASIHITVEDKDGKFPKVKWNNSVSGNDVAGKYRWNGKPDGSITVPPGEYTIWIKAVDRAGNDETQTQSVTIPVSLSSLSASIFDTFTDDQSASYSDVPEDEANEEITSPNLIFGGLSTIPGDTANQSLSVSADASSAPGNPFPWGQILGPITIAAGAATFVATRTKRQRSEELKAETSARIQAERGAVRKAKARANEASKKKMLSRKMERIEAQEDIQWEKAVVARQQALEQAQKNAQVQAGLEAYYNARKQGEIEAAATIPPKEKSWWGKYIINPAKDILSPKTVVTVALAGALASILVTTAKHVSTYNNVFDVAQKNAQYEWQQLFKLHPKTDQNTKFNYLYNNPYEAFSIGYDTTKALANSAAGYIDAIWQLSPISQAISNGLHNIGKNCPEILGEAWYRRCAATFAFGASVLENPTDTLVSLGTSLIADPTAGAIKTMAFSWEYNNPFLAISELSESIQQNGLGKGMKEFWDRRIILAKELIHDPQVQAFGFISGFTLLSLIGLGIPAALIGGGIVLFQAASTLAQIDNALQTAKTRLDAMKAVKNQQTRRQIATILALLGILIYGGARGLNEINRFSAFQDSFSPSAQAQYISLSLKEQFALFEASKNLNLSSNFIEYYLQESGRPNSSLLQIPLLDALRVLNGEVVQLSPELAVELAKDISATTGRNAWASSKTGNVYVSTSTAKAIEAAKQLTSEGIDSPNALALIRIIAQESARGSGNRFVLGPFSIRDTNGFLVENSKVNKGIYIQNALDEGAKFFDTGEVWNILEDGGINPNELWLINQETIQIQLENKVSIIEFKNVDVENMLAEYKTIPDNQVPIRVREIRWLKTHAIEYGYQQTGNMWALESNR